MIEGETRQMIRLGGWNIVYSIVRADATDLDVLADILLGLGGLQANVSHHRLRVVSGNTHTQQQHEQRS